MRRLSKSEDGVSVKSVFDVNKRTTEEKHLIRKLDLRLLPIIILIFIMNYIDRIAITAARLNGFEQDLGLTDVQYDTVVAIFYASYCSASIPSNMILNRVSRPSMYIGICVILWGLTSTLTGVTHNFAGIISCRVFIGLPEAAFYPGAVYLLSRWYTRKELTFRSPLIYCGLLASNAFGSLMAAGILTNMEGKRGIRGWRWLFFVEGAITISIGFLSIWVLPDYPNNTRWLSNAERHLAQVRLAEDAGEADLDCAGDSMWSGFKMACQDIKTPFFAALTAAQLLGLSFVTFFPTITATLGFKTRVSLLLAAPPWILATVLCCLNSFHAAKRGEHFFHIVLPWWVAIIGYIIAISTFSTGGRYVAMLLMASGYAGAGLTLVWTANSIPRPPAKRAAVIGIVNGFGNIGALVGSFVWKVKWSPQYHQSMYIGIAALVSANVFSLAIRLILMRDNKQLDEDGLSAVKQANQERVEEAARLEGITMGEAMQKRSGYRYLY
ncbi:MFS general substrate transporter [Phellopilus nigrolimitatus]|nr:MFS general substrate transporter [Phellopilus nigrolimitatus]